jgi:hypothetical protein
VGKKFVNFRKVYKVLEKIAPYPTKARLAEEEQTRQMAG